jgi:hypothetical protein
MNRIPTIGIIVLMISTGLFAAPRIRPHIPPKKHAPVVHHGTPLPAIKDIPWQLVLAGGAAASGVVFAYKVSDGIQQGTIESARQAPEAFLDKSRGFGGIIMLAVAIGISGSITYLTWNLTHRNNHNK